MSFTQDNLKRVIDQSWTNLHLKTKVVIQLKVTILIIGLVLNLIVSHALNSAVKVTKNSSITDLWLGAF